ncbi:MAG: hypothetical protein ACOCTG_01635, partial [Bacteroidota bacterium]
MRTRSLLLVVALMVATTASAQPLELPEGPMRPFLNVQSALQKAYARKTADTGFLLAERLN